MSGPYETEAQARDALRHLYEAVAPREWSTAVEAVVLDTCRKAGVELGAYDRRLITWFSTWGWAETAWLTGLIERAYAAGKAAS